MSVWSSDVCSSDLAGQPSAALPGLSSPVDVRGRHLFDGALRRTMHASVLLERDIDLLIGINPLVPFNAGLGDARGGAPVDDANDGQRLVNGGLPAVLSQTFRTLLQSRMHVGLARYAQQYPRSDEHTSELQSLMRIS